MYFQLLRPLSGQTRRLGVFAIVLFATNTVYGQNTSFSLASGSTTQGGTVALSLSLSSSAPVPPSALQWTLTYATSDVLSISAAAGPVLTAAGKTITGQAGSGTLSCLASGMNGSTIANGVA